MALVSLHTLRKWLASGFLSVSPYTWQQLTGDLSFLSTFCSPLPQSTNGDNSQERLASDVSPVSPHRARTWCAHKKTIISEICRHREEAMLGSARRKPSASKQKFQEK